MAKFPQIPRYYFWYYLDMNYFEIGAIQVLKDNENHKDHLRSQPNFRASGWLGVSYAKPYLYQNDDGETLSMYWEAGGGQSPHYPQFEKDTVKPIVDGFIPFDFQELLNKTIGR